MSNKEENGFSEYVIVDLYNFRGKIFDLAYCREFPTSVANGDGTSYLAFGLESIKDAIVCNKTIEMKKAFSALHKGLKSNNHDIQKDASNL